VATDLKPSDDRRSSSEGMPEEPECIVESENAKCQFFIIICNSLVPTMRKAVSSPRQFLWLAGLFLLTLPANCEEPGSCSPGEGGSCKSPDADALGPEAQSSFCAPSTSLYDNGGSAQAYRPGAPLSDEVCRPEMADEFRYKSASWPSMRRSRRKGSAPKLDVKLNVFSCKASTGEECMCKPIAREAAKSPSSVVEIWQPRPDGQYSSLRALMPDSNDCRAQVPLTNEGVAHFATVAPGSTGTMGGLGPGGWEWNPYGPPVIHFLVRAKGHAPLLVDLPILVHPKTLEPRNFSIGDFRGVAWVRGNPAELPMKIRSWSANVAENKISLEVDVYMQPAHPDQPEFCPSYMYGTPASFFLEPISVCAPSLMDFFAL
jgi:hypothetical protein